jgi:hypothetical protein
MPTTNTTKTTTKRATTKRVACPGGAEAHAEHLAMNGECPWCGAGPVVVDLAAKRAAKTTSAAKRSTTKATTKPAASKSTAKATTATTSAAKRSTTKTAGVPKGYTVRWKKGACDLLKRDAGVEGPAWLTLCVEHGTTKPADSQRAAKSQGWTAKRVEWCAPCRKASQAR